MSVRHSNKSLYTNLIAFFSALAFCGVAIASPLRYAEDRAPAIVNPLFTTTMAEARLNEMVFDGLFADDQELRSTPRLARSHSLADDKMSMTIELRTDVRWHDSAPFTAADVVFTIAAMKAEGTASTEAARVAWIDTYEASGDHSLRLTFTEAQNAPEDMLHFKILPATLFDSPVVKRTDAFRTKPIGTGPFKVVAFNDDNSIQLQRFVAYYDEATLDEVTMREVADKNYQSKLLLYESLEALVRVLPRDLAALQNDRSVSLYPYQTNSWWYLGFNLKQETFQEASVRSAISSMIDKSELLAPIGTGELLTGPFVRSSPFYNHDVSDDQPDNAKAREMMTAAGFEHDGRYWSRDGEPLTVRLAAMSNLEVAQDVVINLQSQLQSQGIRVEPVFLSPAEWKDQVWRERDFELILSQWSFDRNEDIYEQFHSKGSRNFVSYANEDVDKVLEQATTTLDPQEKRALLRQAHAMIHQDIPMVFLWTLDSYAAMRTSVRNVVVHPFYFFTWAPSWTTD
jgi:peptide/nickel transport system substrate-binding protein